MLPGPSESRDPTTLESLALPGLDVAAIHHFCEQRAPPHALHQVRIETDVSPTAVTIVKVRAPWREDYGPEWTRGGVTRLRYVAKHKHWVLYWRDRNRKCTSTTSSSRRPKSSFSLTRSTVTPAAPSGAEPRAATVAIAVSLSPRLRTDDESEVVGSGPDALHEIDRLVRSDKRLRLRAEEL